MDGFWLCKDNPRLDVNNSFQFWNWNAAGLQTVSEIANSAPNGIDSTADAIQDTSTGQHRILRTTQGIGYERPWLDFSTVYYVKPIDAQERVKIIVRAQDTTIASNCTFDFTTGEMFFYDNQIHAQMEYLGNDWWRLVMTSPGVYNNDVGTVNMFSGIYLVEPGGTSSISFTGDGTSGVKLWKSFTFFSDEANHYLPDVTEASASEYVYTPTRSVRLYPDWDFEILKTQRRYSSSDLTGRRSQFITGDFKKWKLPVKYIEAYRAHMINEWWRDGDTVYFYNGIDYTTTKCLIINKSEPFVWAINPYDDLMYGVIELEAA